MLKTTIQEKSWIMYDWANSAYSVTIMTAVLPIYYKIMASQAGIELNMSTAYWAYANTIATLIISTMAPLFGALGDYKGNKKRLFLSFWGVGVVFTAMLSIVPISRWHMLVLFYILSMIGFAGANIFYDAFLVDVTSKDRMEKISVEGFAFGYIGSVIPFILSILIIAFHSKIGILEITAYKATFVITAIWWGVFSVPLIKNVKQVFYIDIEPNPIKMSVKRLLNTLVHIKENRHIFMFLVAYFFYIDGVSTIIKMAAAYGIDIGLGTGDLLAILLVTQIAAFPFALLYGKLSEIYSSKRMIHVAIYVYIFICIFAYQINSASEYWVLALLVASSQGGIQALSRSYFGKIIPKEKSNEFFGFYNIFGKFASIMGPLIFGMISQITGKSQNAVFGIVALFIIGGIILAKLPAEK